MSISRAIWRNRLRWSDPLGCHICRYCSEPCPLRGWVGASRLATRPNAFGAGHPQFHSNFSTRTRSCLAFWKVGGTVRSIVVMWIKFDVARKKLGWSRISRSGDVRGYVSGRYRPSGPSVKDLLLVAGSGPAANIASGGLAAMVATYWAAPQLPHTPIASWGASMIGFRAPEQHEALLVAAGQWAWAHWLWMQGHTAIVLFAILSIGIGLLNLAPYGGSDGQHILHALRLRKAMRAANRRKP